MTRSVNFILIMLLLNGLFSCDTRSADSYLEEAYELGDSGKYSEAIIVLDKAIEKKPDFIAALIERGYYKMILTKNNDAIKDFQTVLSLDKSVSLAMFDIGCCYYNLDEPKKAITYFDMALAPSLSKKEFEIDSAEILFYRGNSYVKIDSVRKAYNDFKYCVEQNHRLGDCYFYIATLYLASNNKDKGCKNLATAIVNGKKDIPQMYLTACGFVVNQNDSLGSH